MQLTAKHLKIFTTAMMLVCLAFFVGWPSFMGDRPGPAAPVAVNKAYAVRFFTYLSLMVFALILSAIGAIGVLRKTASEYKAQQTENMRELIQATMEDHQKKSHDVE